MGCLRTSKVAFEDNERSRSDCPLDALPINEHTYISKMLVVCLCRIYTVKNDHEIAML